MRTRQHHARYLCVLAVAVLLPALASAHGPAGQEAALAPLDPELFSGWQAWVHLLVQWAHLLGLPLWLGVQLLSGVVQMAVATPFALSPYLWNLETLRHVRFGWTYTVLMAIKHGLILGVVGITGLLTWRYRAAGDRGDIAKGAMNRWLHAANLALGLAIAWVMIMLLLVHEGIDHAL